MPFGKVGLLLASSWGLTAPRGPGVVGALLVILFDPGLLVLLYTHHCGAAVPAGVAYGVRCRGWSEGTHRECVHPT